MRKLVGMLAAAALVALLVAPATAAGTKSGCKGKWTDAGVCSFTYEGGGFTVQAAGVGDPLSIVSIRLEAAGPADGTNVLLLSCGAAVGGPGAPAACGGSTSSGDLPYQPEVGDELTCTVTGNGTGKYRCMSGG